MTEKTKTLLKGFAKLAVTGALLFVSLRTVRFDTVLESLRRAHEGLLFLSALLLVLGGFAGAASWHLVLRMRLPALAYREAAACHWIGMFFNSFLPSNVGGDAVKGYLVARGKGQTGFIVTSLLLDRALNLGLLLCLGGFSLLLHLGRPFLAAGLLALLALSLLGTLAAARRLLGGVRRWPRAGLRGKTAAWLEPVFELAAAPSRLLPLLLAALASQFLKTLSSLYLVFALGLKIPVACVWYVIPLFGVVSALPVSIGGLGVRELAAQWIAGPLRVDGTHLVTLSLAGHLLVVLVNMLGLVPFMSTRCRRASCGS